MSVIAATIIVLLIVLAILLLALFLGVAWNLIVIGFKVLFVVAIVAFACFLIGKIFGK